MYDGERWIKNERDYLYLRGLVELRHREIYEFADAVKRYADRDYVLDAASPDDQRDIDLVYKHGPLKNGAGLAEGDEEALARLRRFIKRTGVVPREAMAYVGGGTAEAISAQVAPQSNASITSRELGGVTGESPSEAVFQPASFAASRGHDFAQLGGGRNGDGSVADAAGTGGSLRTAAEATGQSKPVEQVVIFVGGANDGNTENVMSYSRNYRAEYAPASWKIMYFENGHVDEIATAIDAASDAGHRITIYGHSWGADAALRAAAQSGKPVQNLVTIDPVGKLKTRARRTRNVEFWLNVNGDPEKRDISDAIESLGKFGGIDIRHRNADADLTVSANHRDFAGMMMASGAWRLPNGPEERNRFLGPKDMKWSKDGSLIPIPRASPIPPPELPLVAEEAPVPIPPKRPPIDVNPVEPAPDQWRNDATILPRWSTGTSEPVDAATSTTPLSDSPHGPRLNGPAILPPEFMPQQPANGLPFTQEGQGTPEAERAMDAIDETFRPGSLSNAPVLSSPVGAESAFSGSGALMERTPAEIQTFLNAIGITDMNGQALTVDGVIGPKTQSAIDKYLMGF